MTDAQQRYSTVRKQLTGVGQKLKRFFDQLGVRGAHRRRRLHEVAGAAQKGGAMVIKTDAYYARIAGFRADRVIKNKHRDTYHHFLSYNRAPVTAFMQFLWTVLAVTRMAFPGDLVAMIT